VFPEPAAVFVAKAFPSTAEQRLDVAGIEAVEPLGVPRRLDAIGQQQLGETPAKEPPIEKRVLYLDDQMSISIACSRLAPRGRGARLGEDLATAQPISGA